MPLNPALKNIVWMHTLTHLKYKLEGNFGCHDGVIVLVESDELQQWADTGIELADFTKMIREGDLVIRFTPNNDDMIGVAMIKQKCLQALNALHGKHEPGASKKDVGIRQGKGETLKMILGVIDGYMGVILKKPVEVNAEQAPIPAEACTDEQADEVSADAE